MDKLEVIQKCLRLAFNKGAGKYEAQTAFLKARSIVIKMGKKFGRKTTYFELLNVAFDKTLNEEEAVQCFCTIRLLHLQGIVIAKGADQVRVKEKIIYREKVVYRERKIPSESKSYIEQSQVFKISKFELEKTLAGMLHFAYNADVLFRYVTEVNPFDSKYVNVVGEFKSQDVEKLAHVMVVVEMYCNEEFTGFNDCKKTGFRSWFG
jgi:hypothetical protein